VDKFFKVIKTEKDAWIGLVSSTIAVLVSFQVPEKLSWLLIILGAPSAIFCFSLLLIRSWIPSLLSWVSDLKLVVKYAGESDEPKEASDGDLEFLPADQSAAFFAKRFSSAFPGIRKITWYSGKDAVDRLNILLRQPLNFRSKNGYTTPIWWWRNGNLQISEFKVLSRKRVLIDRMELKIKSIAAVPGKDYYRSFVYLEAHPERAVFPKDWNESRIAEAVELFGYASEEYGLYRKKFYVSRSEYDDGAATIKGKVFELGDDVELRERYITRFNLVIAPHLSPINNTDFDSELRALLNGILHEGKSLEELANRVEKLPKPRMWGIQ
tara:strand:+ start:2571 stop:3545 length:975 start_codon:yes stop_codon:yes gene_type:complete